MTNDTFDSTCLRHPEVASNLRCGRCGDLICPQCMVQSPVGARCPECSSIGEAPIFRSTSMEMARTIGLAVIGAIGFGIAFALLAWVLWQLPFNFKIGSVAVGMVIAATGMPIGEFIRRAGKYKLDKRLRIVAALTVMSSWIVGQVVANFLNLPITLFTNIIAVIGLGIGVYIAMNRVKP
jgi:MFS family permease